MSELPQGWELTTIGSIAQIKTGKTPSTTKDAFYNGDIPFFKPSDLDIPMALNKAETTVSLEGAMSVGILPKNTVLVSCIGNLGKVGLTTVESICNQQINAIHPTPRALPEYILYWSQLLKPWLEANSSATTIAIINKGRFSNAPIPLPPLEEQRRIVAKLDVMLGRSKAARQELTAAAQLAKRQRQAVLAQAFSGELSADVNVLDTANDLLDLIPPTKSTLKKRNANLIENITTPPFEIPDNWQWTNIGGIFDVAIGGTPSRQNPEFWEGDIPWVSSGEVAFTRIKNTRQTITQEGILNSSAKLLPVGTVLLGMIGEGKTRGQAAILDIPATSNQNIAAILCSQTPIPSEWLYYWLQASYSVTRGDGAGGVQPALNSDRVRQLLIPIAPLEEQRAIVARIESAFARIDAIEHHAQHSLALAERLEQATLAKAFRGEL